MMTADVDIWIVDDDEAIRFVLQRALGKRGYEVACFDHVGAVRTALESGHPRAILTDIRLPDADGLSVVEILRERSIEIPPTCSASDFSPPSILLSTARRRASIWSPENGLTT